MNINLKSIAHLLATLIIAVTLISDATPVGAAKRPDPVVAVLMSLGSTLIPIALGTILWTQDRGVDEGFRYDAGFVFLALGGILGPSTGKFYADQESDAWATLLVRGLTGSMGLAGCALWLRGEEAQTRNNGRALAAIGLSTTSLFAVYDIWTAGSAALQTQRQRGYGPGTSDLTQKKTGRLAFANTPGLGSDLQPLIQRNLRQPRLRTSAKPRPSLLASSLMLSSAFARPE